MHQRAIRTSQVAILLLLTGCGQNSLLGQAVVNTSVIYPNMPDIDPPFAPAMRPVHVDFGKDPVKEFVTLDQSNWGNLVYNIQALKGLILQYQARINEVNKERADWRDKNNSSPTSSPSKSVK